MICKRELETGILIPEQAVSYGKMRPATPSDKLPADDAEMTGKPPISGDKHPVLGNFSEIVVLLQKHVAGKTGISYNIANTRAVPLVRKDDAHQGRVFYFRQPGTCEEHGL